MCLTWKRIGILELINSVSVELSKEQREKLGKSKRIANPGCYPTGFIGLTRPLVDAGILKEGTGVTVNAISGYSGGGKGLMNIFENEEHEPWGAYGFSLVSFSGRGNWPCAQVFLTHFFTRRHTNTFLKWQSIQN